MPQAIRHLQVRPLSRACEAKIRMATQRAANLYRRAHCVPILNVFPELEGVCDIDVHTTMQHYRRKDNSYRAEISAIVSDGLWSLARKKQAGLVSDATCRG